jgi:hypothetical protein
MTRSKKLFESKPDSTTLTSTMTRRPRKKLKKNSKKRMKPMRSSVMRTTEKSMICSAIPEARKGLVELKVLVADSVMSSGIFSKISLVEEDGAALEPNKGQIFNIILNYPLRKPFTEKKLNLKFLDGNPADHVKVAEHERVLQLKHVQVVGEREPSGFNRGSLPLIDPVANAKGPDKWFQTHVQHAKDKSGCMKNGLYRSPFPPV